MKLKEIFLIGLLCGSVAWAQDTKTSNGSGAVTEAVSEEELVAAAERLIAQETESAAENAIESAKVSDTNAIAETKASAVNEKEIPAFRSTESAKIVETGSWQRIAISAGLVLALALGLFFGVQKFAKRSSVQNQKLRMDVISQHHFSPKRSLIVVRIAGEHLLIGATDQSINLIKPITLIDDEAEGTLPQDFNNFLEDDFVQKRTFHV